MLLQWHYFILFYCQAYFETAPHPPLLFHVGHVSSYLKAWPLFYLYLYYLFIYLLRVAFTYIPCKKQPFIGKGYVGEIGCRLYASIAYGQNFLVEDVVSPHPGYSLHSLPYTPVILCCIHNPLHAVYSHSKLFLVHLSCSYYCLCLQSPPKSILLKNLSFLTQSKCYVLNDLFEFFWVSELATLFSLL